MVKAPTGNASDSLIAHGTTSTLFIPEKAKGASTPKRIPHVISFAFFEVGFIGRVVRVGFAFDFDVSFDGGAHGVVQPDLTGLPLVVACCTKEGSVATLATDQTASWIS